MRTAWRVTHKKPANETISEEIRALGDEHPIDEAVHALEEFFQTATKIGLRSCVAATCLFRYARAPCERKTTRNTRTSSGRESGRIPPPTRLNMFFRRARGSHERHKSKVFVHRLGNLVLLPPGLNSKLGDADPSAKAPDYTQTGLFIARGDRPPFEKVGSARGCRRRREQEVGCLGAWRMVVVTAKANARPARHHKRPSPSGTRRSGCALWPQVRACDRERYGAGGRGHVAGAGTPWPGR